MTKEEINQKIISLKGENLQEELNLRGKLIKAIKEEIKKEKDANKKVLLNAELLKNLEEHKKTILKLEKEQGKIIDIPKKVGMKIQEIADTIKIFMGKEDILNKLKMAGLSTTVCTAFMTAITVGLSGLTGTLSLSTLASLFPSICYVALSNVIRMGLTETEKSKLMKVLANGSEISKLTEAFVKENILENKEFLEDLKTYKKLEKSNYNEAIILAKKLIEHYKKMAENAPNKEIKNSIRLELVGILTELNKYLDIKMKNYIDDKEDVKFIDLEKERAAVKLELFNLSSNLKDVSIETGKNIGKSAIGMYLSRMLLSTIFPTLKFTDVSSALQPLLYTIISNLATADKLKEKINIAKSNYIEQIIKFHNKDLAEEIFGKFNMNNSVKAVAM